jgi:rhodanese-related sulfurtransferase
MRIAEAPRHPKGYYQVRPGDVVGRDDLLFVDVREEVDLSRDLGHVHGVTHVPSAALVAHGLPGVDESRPIVVVCNDGRESQRCATALVAEHGFTEVYHLVGGMVRWNAEERPVARARTWRPL